MARRHYWQFLVTDEGNPIENAQITIYKAGTEEPVFVYTDELGSVGTNVEPQTVTSKKGFFEFWLADETDPNGYPVSTKFKVSWVAPGVSAGYIDYIDVFSATWEEVDETDTNELKNKTVSNNLAYLWEQHRQAVLPGSTPHGLDYVDEADATSATKGFRNKVISNYQAFIWDTHAKRQWDGTLAPAIAPNETPTAHGILQTDAIYSGIDSINGDELKKYLVSNDLANFWNDHSNNVPVDPHPQYMGVVGNTTVNAKNFTGEVGYASITSISSLASVDSFITKRMLNSFTYGQTIDTGDWTNNGDGTYSYIVNHNLGVTYPLFVVWKVENGGVVVMPDEVRRIDDHSTIITVTEIDTSYFVRFYYQNDAIPPL